MQNFYVIGKKDFEPEIPNSPEWPKIIGYCYETNSFLFIEGNGYGFNGIVLPEAIAREPRWDRLFEILDANWFLQLIDNKPRPDKALMETNIKSKTGIIEIIQS
ncbi:hypothetical protein [Pseudomonas sp. IzPS59]|uniref:hypothetical protein n=1 Tax=Pseudomonas sp. IzPS59 TaxID=2774459 RepID=UPI0017878C47|nr:hypothetical protein [Pseudomonas sp. IzPS59]